MKPAALVTVCRGATLAAALDLVASFAAHHDGARIEVVVADAAPGLDDAGPGGARLVSGHDVAGEVFGVLATAYAAGRLEAALVPFALRRLRAPPPRPPRGGARGRRRRPGPDRPPRRRGPAAGRLVGRRGRGCLRRR